MSSCSIGNATTFNHSDNTQLFTMVKLPMSLRVNLELTLHEITLDISNYQCLTHVFKQMSIYTYRKRIPTQILKSDHWDCAKPEHHITPSEVVWVISGHQLNSLQRLICWKSDHNIYTLPHSVIQKWWNLHLKSESSFPIFWKRLFRTGSWIAHKEFKRQGFSKGDNGKNHSLPKFANVFTDSSIL